MLRSSSFLKRTVYKLAKTTFRYLHDIKPITTNWNTVEHAKAKLSKVKKSPS